MSDPIDKDSPAAITQGELEGILRMLMELMRGDLSARLPLGGRENTLHSIHEALNATAAGLAELRSRLEDKLDESLEARRTLQAQLENQRLIEERLRTAIAEKDLLLQAVHHRVKNNLQVVSSLLRLQSLGLQGRELEPFKQSEERIRSIALVHEHLYEAGDLERAELGAYARLLGGHLFRSSGVDTSRVRLSVDPVEMSIPIDTAIPLSLILHELLSNAIRHGFPDGSSGEVRIGLERHGARCRVSVQDSGRGLPEGVGLHEGTKLGLRLVCALAEQIDATIEIIRESGTTFRLEFSSAA